MATSVRTVRPHEWPQLKALRLDALRDPVSTLAFGSTYARESAFGDAVWQQRAGGTTFVAQEAGGDWVGMATLLAEDGQAHLAGMYVRPGHRGSGTAAELVRAALERAWEEPGTARVRLWVAEANGRAYAFYRRLGFTATGATMPHEPDPRETACELAVPRP